MTVYFYKNQPVKSIDCTPLPNFLFEAPFQSLISDSKILYSMILERLDNNLADEYSRIYVYFPIREIAKLLHCGQQKASTTLRKLQYIGLINIKKQGCGKPNIIYPKYPLYNSL